MSRSNDDKTIAQKVKEFKEQNQETLENFALGGWSMSSDLGVADLFMQIAAEYGGDDLNLLSRVVKETKSERAQQWTEQCSDWEETMDVAARIESRSNFLASCMKKMVSHEFLCDSKLRWERAEFSSVTTGFLVIGDIVVPRRGDKLPLKDEVDLKGSFSHMGRTDLTYSVWKQMGFAAGITGVRAKINGERFILSKKDSLLRGWKDLLVPDNFLPELVEYYAGRYYVLFPFTKDSLKYEVLDLSDSKTKEIVFLPHPFVTPTAYSAQWDVFCCHKYDGLMLWHQGKEYRTKWDPTVEVSIDGVVWEVYLREKLIPLRPRPGKVSTSSANAISRLASCLRTGALRLQLVGDTIAREVIPLDTKQETKKMVGTKVFFFSSLRKMYLIREPNKRLDAIGGLVEFGESHLDAGLREIKEETGLVLAPDSLLYLGISKEETDGGTWISHVYVACSPLVGRDAELAGRPWVESFSIGSFRDFKNSDLGRPRQVWLARHLDFLAEKFGTFDQVWQYMVMHGKCDPIAITIPKDTLRVETQVYARVLQSCWERLKLGSGTSLRRLEEALRSSSFWFDDVYFSEAVKLHDSTGRIFANSKLPLPKQDTSRVAYCPPPETTAVPMPHQSPDAVEYQLYGTFAINDDVPGDEDFVPRPLLHRLPQGHSWPEGPSAIREFLSVIFAGKKQLVAQIFYQRLRKCGFSGARRPAVKMVDKWVSERYLVVGPQQGGGRVFSLGD